MRLSPSRVTRPLSKLKSASLVHYINTFEAHMLFQVPEFPTQTYPSAPRPSAGFKNGPAADRRMRTRSLLSWSILITRKFPLHGVSTPKRSPSRRPTTENTENGSRHISTSSGSREHKPSSQTILQNPSTKWRSFLKTTCDICTNTLNLC